MVRATIGVDFVNKNIKRKFINVILKNQLTRQALTYVEAYLGIENSGC